MLNHIALDESAVRTWLEDGYDSGGYFWLESFSREGPLTAESLHDFVGDATMDGRCDPGAAAIHLEPETGTSSWELGIIATVSLGGDARLASAPFTLREINSAIDLHDGEESAMHLLRFIVGRLNACVDELNERFGA